MGVHYEETVAAFLAVKMLAGAACEVWDGITGDALKAVTMQDAEVVDDVVIDLGDDGAPKAYVSAKDHARRTENGMALRLQLLRSRPTSDWGF